MGKTEAPGGWAHGPHALSLPPPPAQVRPVALKRPDNVSLSLSPNKRVCPSPLAQVEGSPAGSNGSQVSQQGGRERVAGNKGQGSCDPALPPQAALKLEPLHFLQCHSKNNSRQDLETQLWGCAFEPAWEDGTALVGRQGQLSRCRSRNATWRELSGWVGKSGGTESLESVVGQVEGAVVGDVYRKYFY